MEHDGGETGIRTLGRLAPSTVFETAPFDHSGTSPRGQVGVYCAARFFARGNPLRADICVNGLGLGAGHAYQYTYTARQKDDRCHASLLHLL
jgi:hypothetical protein